MRILWIACVAGPLVLGGCMEETRVINDHSVAAQFSQFGKNGWAVSSGETRQERKKMANAALPPPGAGASNFFGDVHWTTNLKVDNPSPDVTVVGPNAGAGAAGVAPPAGLGMMAAPNGIPSAVPTVPSSPENVPTSPPASPPAAR